jgi:hypothetical protein
VNEGFTGLLLSSHLDREGGNVRDMIRLRPNEGVVIRISVGNHSDLLRLEKGRKEHPMRTTMLAVALSAKVGLAET